MAVSLLTRFAEDPVVKPFLTIGDARDRFEYLLRAFKPDDGIRLRDMPYESFLRTAYWLIIRNYLFSVRESKCSKCTRTGALSLHHLTYDHHGYEHQHLDDLIFLCRECHENNHKPLDEMVSELLKNLAEQSTKFHVWKPVDNPNYDPTTLMNLRRYGDIRGRVDEQA